MRLAKREGTAFSSGETAAMRGGCGALLLLALLAAAPCTTFGDVAPAPPMASSDSDPGDVVDPELVRAEATWLREAETALLAQQLARMLRQAAPDGAEEDARWRGDQPTLLFDTAAADAFAAGDQTLPDALQDVSDPSAGVWAVGKRSRYYRRYPWKRQPGRGGGMVGDADNPYMCNPTREDVFRLLAALHDARAGNVGRTVSFCNRRRPAAAVFTNIRFLGRRR